MKTKWIFGIVAVVMILSVFSFSQGADKFYYGTYNWSDITKDFQYIRDSLRCNILWGKCTDATVDSFKDHSLRAIVQNMWGEHQNSPSMWAWKSHYTMWEAEGLDESWVNLEYDGGTEVNDPSASGGKAMKFTGPGTPGLIQEGPNYYQEPGGPIFYTAEFRLRFIYSLYQPLGAMGPGPPPNPKVCSLMVVDTVSHSILKDTVIYKGDFPGGGIGPYQTFTLEDYTVPSGNKIEFQIYWFGIAGDLYIDYVKAYDNNGKQLMSGLKDTVIMDYVDSQWVHETIPETGETVVYRWYLRNEPTTIDLFATNRYIDNLLKEVSSERVGFQTFHKYREDSMVW
ncbi:MAG: hypothetical protein KAW16_03750 [candidate division Zixibacteria bacterium]|nr:hypothetical protein [candidate division Zixibacteria bacterium]